MNVSALYCLRLSNEGLVPSANERPVRRDGGIWIICALGALVLPALSFARQMLWGLAEFIISSQDWGKHIIVVKQCMAFESGPEWKVTLS
jgi:hypothetical protein